MTSVQVPISLLAKSLDPRSRCCLENGLVLSSLELGSRGCCSRAPKLVRLQVWGLGFRVESILGYPKSHTLRVKYVMVIYPPPPECQPTELLSYTLNP